MKNFVLIFVSLIAFSLSAQVSFKTGNVQLDADLNIINANGSANFGVFKKDLVVAYDVPASKIDNMRLTLNMSAGEIYFALEIARIIRRPIEDVLMVYKKDKSKGWGYMAKQLGIKPGSPEFHQLKNNAKSKGQKKHGGNNVTHSGHKVTVGHGNNKIKIKNK